MSGALILLGLAFVVFAGLVLVLVIHADRTRRAHRARLMRVRAATATLPAQKSRPTQSASETLGLFAKVDAHLAQTSLRVSVPEVMVQLSLGVLGLYALCVLVAGLHPMLALPVAIVTPLLIAVMVLRIAKNRYRFAFTAALPEALDVFARGLRAGRPVADSLAIVVETGEGPINREIARCHAEICMGKTLAESLSRLEQRICTPEVSFFSVATSLQTETGGNLIETMENLATQLRERRKLRKKARALSSEARASAMILAALPFAVALAIGLLNSAYLEPLYADVRGQVMAGAALCSIGLGVFIMAQMGKLDV